MARYILRKNDAKTESISSVGLQPVLNEMASTLDIAVELGSNLVEWTLNSVVDGHLPSHRYLASMLLHDMLMKADAVSILLRARSSEPAKLHVRSMIEGMLGIEYLCREQSECLAEAYLIMDWLKSMKLLLGGLEGTSEHAEALRFAHDDDISKSISVDLTEDDLRRMISEIKVKLLNPNRGRVLSDILINRRRNWYSIFGGPANVRSLAKEVRLLSYYDSFYRIYSGATHASDSLSNMFGHLEGGFLKPVRQVDNAPSIFYIAMTILMRSLTTISRSLEFRDAAIAVQYVYASKIREPYHRLGSINVEYAANRGREKS